MKCGCDAASTASEQIADMLRSGGFSDLFGQLDLVRRSILAMEQRLRTAERADALGLGSQVAEIHRAAANRENRQTARYRDSIA